ncbi:MAG: thioesterase family protein [Anaerolineales bacterium]|jgi:acyl-CoA thioester hydrolase
MSKFHFYAPIEVRYGDLDPQGHVNNAKYLTYIEQARLQYLRHLNLWKGGSFLEIGVILAEVKLNFHASIQFGQRIQVGVKVTYLGNKSLNVEHSIEEAKTGQQMASGSSVLVAYDYRTASSILIPPEWRQIITEFEGLPSES